MKPGLKERFLMCMDYYGREYPKLREQDTHLNLLNWTKALGTDVISLETQNWEPPMMTHIFGRSDTNMGILKSYVALDDRTTLYPILPTPVHIYNALQIIDQILEGHSVDESIIKAMYDADPEKISLDSHQNLKMRFVLAFKIISEATNIDLGQLINLAMGKENLKGYVLVPQAHVI